jgi:hypothetical protein
MCCLQVVYVNDRARHFATPLLQWDIIIIIISGTVASVFSNLVSILWGEWVGALKLLVCTTATSQRNLHTNNANNTKSVSAAISAELETPLLIQARRHSINQATSPKVMLSCQSATPIKESHGQEVMCKDTKCKIIRRNPNGYQFNWIWMLRRWWRYGLWTQQCGS